MWCANKADNSTSRSNGAREKFRRVNEVSNTGRSGEGRGTDDGSNGTGNL